MKYKKMLIYMLVFALIFSPVSVCASDSADETTDVEVGVDANGWYFSGVINYHSLEGKYSGSYNITGYKLYVRRGWNDNNQCYSYGFGDVSGMTWSYSGIDDVGGKVYTSTGSDNTPEYFQPLGVCDTMWTNLPVFDDRDADFAIKLQAYFDSGDVSGASNYEDLIPEEKVDVPEVKNLKITSGFYEGSRKENVWEFITPITVQWECDDNDGLSYEIEFREKIYALEKYKSVSDVLSTVFSGWQPLTSLGGSYSDTLSPYKATINSHTLEDKRDEVLLQALGSSVIKNAIKNDVSSGLDWNLFSWIENSLTLFNISNSEYIDYYFANSKVDIRIRNVDLDGNYSDWVTVSLNYDDNSSTGYTGDGDDEEGSTEEVDWETDDRVDEDDSEPTTEIDWDNDADGDVGLLDLIKTIIKLIGNVLKTITTALTTFINFIMSGFGLLGDNGLLSFFKSFFTFIPKDVWTLIGTGLSLSIILMVLRFFKK